MKSGPYSPYTKYATWAALYSQHLNAGYALVQHSLTSNSLVMITLPTATPQLADATQAIQKQLQLIESDCLTFFSTRKEGEKMPAITGAPTILKEAHAKNRLRVAVVLARSSDYYRYQLSHHEDINQVVCGLHDSYLHIPVWETSTNKRYKARETSLEISGANFEKQRTTAYGHKVLLGALICGDEKAIAYKKALPPSTRRRINAEVKRIQSEAYQGRPLTFIGEAKRREVGSKISRALIEYHVNKKRHA